MHDYVPDFLVLLKDVADTTIILETKGFDPLAEVKARESLHKFCVPSLID